MKKIISYRALIILYIGVIVICNSCTDWLDIKPMGQIERSDYLLKEESYRDVLNGVYIKLCDDNLYGRDLTYGFIDALAQYYIPKSTDKFSSFVKYDYKASYSVSHINGVWSGMYNAISNLNSMIEVIDENKENFSDKNYDVIKGEALGLRSFLYFDLVRLFAKSYSEDSTSVAVPYINKLSSEIVSPSKLNEILNLLIEDIKNSISLLENDDLYLNIYGSNVSAVEGRKFYFNYYAAKALLARVYLYKGDFENALMHSEELINDNLVKKNFDWVLYTDLGGTSANKRDRTFAKEVIFSLNDLYITPTWETTFSSVDDGFNSEGGWYKLGDVSYVNSCFERDVYTSSIDYRREYLIESSVNALYYYPTKLIQLSETETRFKNRIPLIRLSEVYYIAAECQKELGNLQAALDYINTVRDHRGYSVADRLSLAVVDDAIKVQNEIFKEYRKEFICEGQMFYYYKRFNSENIYDLKNNLVSTFSRDKSVLPVPDNEKIYGDWNK